ncbi:oxidoreductase [Leucobacter sp. CSA1]|uniref:Oxidoreductase n=1 Tax=Leucobacter chromiisoli TaxID=2796471 RepID=A0A934Q661_9MICO|nr:NAD(P)-dependent oxidoreductase [Leucobacter chromiisoli]MBK0418376.1 oxidoreductase [Leucobacter chromiisoli]
MSAPRILVTPRSLTSGELSGVVELAPLVEAGYELIPGPGGRTPTVEELGELLSGNVVGYLAGVEAIPAEVLRAAPSLRAISRNGVGTDAIDLEAASDAGIRVEIARGANAQGVAELAILHMLAALRDFDTSTGAIREGRWERTRGGELNGRTVGIVGLGAIGRTVAAIAAAFGARVLASDPFVRDSALAAVVDPAELFEQADVITLHSPPGDRPLIDAAALASMRDGAVLVNTARAALVDAPAVLAALRSGRLLAYAVDAFDTEPPELDELLLHPRCRATPHLGGFTEESVGRATAYAVENLLRALGHAQDR